MRFLGKRMRRREDGGSYCWYAGGEWELLVKEWGRGFNCVLRLEKRPVLEPDLILAYGDTAEAAILECEKQALALFGELAELAGYEVEE